MIIVAIASLPIPYFYMVFAGLTIGLIISIEILLQSLKVFKNGEID